MSNKYWLSQQIESAKAALKNIPEDRRKFMRFTGADKRRFIGYDTWGEYKCNKEPTK